MIYAWLIRKFGPRLAMPVLIVAAVALLGLLIWLAWPSGPSAQVKHSAAVAGAYGEAGSAAVETVESRAQAEVLVDKATNQTVQEINRAQNPADVRRAVLAGVCTQPAYRNDPACAVQQTHP